MSSKSEGSPSSQPAVDSTSILRSSCSAASASIAFFFDAASTILIPCTECCSPQLGFRTAAAGRAFHNSHQPWSTHKLPLQRSGLTQTIICSAMEELTLTRAPFRMRIPFSFFFGLAGLAVCFLSFFCTFSCFLTTSSFSPARYNVIIWRGQETLQ